jgi:3-deoxy-7-phosphoheptulonate synthase
MANNADQYIVFNDDAPHAAVPNALDRLRLAGIPAREMTAGATTLIAADPSESDNLAKALGTLSSHARVVRHPHAFLLSARSIRPQSTIVDLGGGVRIGAGDLTLIAGPCSIESVEQAVEVARAVTAAGATIMRGGLFKPRTSPFSFQGLETPGFEVMDTVRRETGIRFVTEAVDEASLDLVERHADMIQIGSRNMQNFALLKAAGRASKPVLLKRGFSATVDELLMAADYILAGGNPGGVVVCERGIRTFCTHTRNTLDLNAVPLLKQLSHLPVIVDPSHGTGRRDLIAPMSLAAVAAGADGLIIEVHPNPDCALSDGDQSLTTAEFAALTPRIVAVASAIGMRLATRPVRAAAPAAALARG